MHPFERMQKVADKLGVSARARAPQDDGEFNELEKRLQAAGKQLKVLPPPPPPLPLPRAGS